VEHRDVIILAGSRMPPEQVVVVEANLSGLVMVANIVIIGLRQGDAEQTQDQDRHSEPTQSRLSRSKTQGHIQASFKSRS
jgi:hypothetical protein